MSSSKETKETTYMQKPTEQPAAAEKKILKDLATAVNLMLGLPTREELPESILNLFGLKKFAPQQNLYIQEKDKDFLYFILDGKVDFAIPAGPGKVSRVKSLGKGQLCGGLRYISREKDNLLATAGAETLLLALHFEDCDLLCREYGPLAPRLMPLYYKRLFVTALGKNNLFASLSLAEKIDLFQFFRVQLVKAGQELIREGSPGDSACLILTGKAESSKESPGQEASLVYYETGSIIGETPLITGSAHPATVVAAEPLGCAYLHKEDLQKLIAKYPLVWKELEALALSHSENILSIMKDVVAEVADSRDYKAAEGQAQDRQDPRFSVAQYEIQARLSAGEKGFSGRVLNISNGGLLLASEEKPALGEVLAVTFDAQKQSFAQEHLNNLILSAKVVRVQEGAMALSVQGAISGELEQYIKFVQEVAARKAKGILYPRYDVGAEKIRVSYTHQNEIEMGQLLNISQTGMLISCDKPPAIGTLIHFRIRLTEKKTATENPFPGDDVIIPALVMRLEEGKAGVQFQYADAASKTRVMTLVGQLARRQGFQANIAAAAAAGGTVAPASSPAAAAPRPTSEEGKKRAVVPLLLSSAKAFLQEYFFNINEGGGFYRGKFKLQVTDEISVRLQLHFKDKKLFKETLDLPATVVKVTPEGVGVKFNKFPPTCTRQLEALVQGLVKRQEHAAWLRRRQVEGGKFSLQMEQTLADTAVPRRPLSTRVLLYFTAALAAGIITYALYLTMEEVKQEKTANFLADEAKQIERRPTPSAKVTLVIDGKEKTVEQKELTTLEKGKDGRLLVKTKDGKAVPVEREEMKKLPAHLQRQAAKLGE